MLGSPLFCPDFPELTFTLLGHCCVFLMIYALASCHLLRPDLSSLTHLPDQEDLYTSLNYLICLFCMHGKVSVYIRRSEDSLLEWVLSICLCARSHGHH